MDEELERAIDEVGRWRVFALVRSMGWRDSPPKWVWWVAISEIKTLIDSQTDVKPEFQEALYSNRSEMYRLF